MKWIRYLLSVWILWKAWYYAIELLFLYMSKKFIIETGDTNKILREKSAPVSQAELREYVNLVHDMVKYIKNPDNGWVWLAAPQIWVNKRIIVVSLMQSYEDEDYRTIAMINPEIIEHSNDECIDKEGCLSVPWESWDVKRWNWIKLRFIDLKGIIYSLTLTELAARIVQHEIDHLDGVLFTDKVIESL